MKKYWFAETALTVVIALVLAFVVTCIEAWIGMLLFNWVIALFGGTFALTFWQTFGIVVALSFIGKFFKNNSSSKS